MTHKFLSLLSLALPMMLLAARPTEEVDQYVEGIFSKSPYPGLAVVLVKDNRIVYEKGFGVVDLKDNQPMTHQTPLAIGSFTKSFTAMLLMQLAEQGKVDLNAPIVTYLPWFQTAIKEKSDLITTSMLLSNTSGIPSMDVGIMSVDLDNDADKRMAQALNAYVLNREPGSSFEYSNEGFALAGLVAEAVTGKTFPTLLQEMIFNPLNMAQSSTDPFKLRQMGVSHGHYPGLNQGIPAKTSMTAVAYAGAGSLLRCSARDLGHYLMALLNQGQFRQQQILKAQSIADMWQTKISMPERPEQTAVDTYGYGWMISQIDGRQVIHHGGATSTMTSYAMLEPNRRSGVVVLSNTVGLDSYRYAGLVTIANNMLHLYHGESLSDFGKPKRADKTRNSFELTAEELAEFPGLYSTSGLSQYRVEVSFNSQNQLQLSAYQGQQWMSQSIIDFRNPTQFVLRNMGGNRLGRFMRNLQGEVYGIRLGGQSLLRSGSNQEQTTQSVASPKGTYEFQLPKNWSIQWHDNGFTALNPSKTIQLEGAIHNNSQPLVDAIGSKYNLTIQSQTPPKRNTYAKRSWQEQSLRLIADGVERQAVLFSTANLSQTSPSSSGAFYLLLQTPKGELTTTMQTEFLPIFKSFTLLD